MNKTLSPSWLFSKLSHLSLPYSFLLRHGYMMRMYQTIYQYQKFSDPFCQCGKDKPGWGVVVYVKNQIAARRRADLEPPRSTC